MHLKPTDQIKARVTLYHDLKLMRILRYWDFCGCERCIEQKECLARAQLRRTHTQAGGKEELDQETEEIMKYYGKCYNRPNACYKFPEYDYYECECHRCKLEEYYRLVGPRR